MALTLTQEPTLPCFSKNVIAYQVTTDTTLVVKARLFVESAPYSDTWEFYTEIKAYPDEDGNCYFYLQDLMEEDILQYDKPSFSVSVQIWPLVCRRFRMDFFEYDTADLVLHDEIYYGGTDEFFNLNDISPVLSSGTDYVLITDKERSNILLSNSLLANQGVNLLYALGDEWWFSFNADYNHNLVVTMKTQETIRIYVGTPPVLTTSAIRFALLGGLEYNRFSLLVQNNAFWGMQDYDLIVDENDNFIGISS